VPMAESLFTAAAEEMNAELLHSFLMNEQRERLFLESQILEFKKQPDGHNIVEAICGMQNSAGGVILVGVDEDDPAAPAGVPANTQDRLVNQCRSLLDPVVIPEIIPIALPSLQSRLVLVVRVAPAEPDDLPVFAASRVWLRVPGATVRATREQVLRLVARRAAGSQLRPSGTALTSLFMPPLPMGIPVGGDEIPDLRIRVAAALPLRAWTGRPLTLRSNVRQQILEAIDGSTTAEWAAGRNPDTNGQPGWTTLRARSDSWEAHRPVKRKWPPKVTLGLQARFDGSRLVFALDVNISSDEPGRLIQLNDLADGLLRLTHLAGQVLPSLVSHLMPLAPAHNAFEDLVAWVAPRQQDLHRLLQLDDLGREVMTEPSTAHRLSNGQRSFSREDLEAPDEAIQDWLVQMLMDDGVYGAEEEAERAMARTSTTGPGDWL
jgi:hypothetical protein